MLVSLLFCLTRLHDYMFVCGENAMVERISVCVAVCACIEKDGIGDSPSQRSAGKMPTMSTVRRKHEVIWTCTCALLIAFLHVFFFSFTFALLLVCLVFVFQSFPCLQEIA